MGKQRQSCLATGPVELGDQDQAPADVAANGVFGQDAAEGQEDNAHEALLSVDAVHRWGHTRERDAKLVIEFEAGILAHVAAGNRERGPVRREQPRDPHALTAGLCVFQRADEVIQSNDDRKQRGLTGAVRQTHLEHRV